MDSRNFTKWFTIDNIIGAIVCIIIGFLFIFLPDSFSNILVIITGVLLILSGVVSITVSFAFKSQYSGYGIGPGIVFIILGIYCMTHISMIKGVLNAFFGVVVICVGAFFFAKSFNSMKNKLDKWIIPMILSFLTLVLGCIVLFATFDAIFVFTGIVLVIVGLFTLVSTIIFNSQARKMTKKSKGPIESEWHEING